MVQEVRERWEKGFRKVYGAGPCATSTDSSTAKKTPQPSLAVHNNHVSDIDPSIVIESKLIPSRVGGFVTSQGFQITTGAASRKVRVC